MISIDESLLYLRHWPQSDNCGELHLLFADGNPKQGIIVGVQHSTVHWKYSCEFVSTAYSEPLECVHARRRAFGGASITFDITLPADFPDRCLLSNLKHNTEFRLGSVKVKWLLKTVFEVPAFCVNIALSQKSRVDWGFEHDQIEMLKAAMTISPNPFDVIGVYTPDGDIVGAIEFAGHLADDVYTAHMVAVARNKRSLSIGDRLYGRYSGNIGETRLITERCLFEILDVGDHIIPALPSYRDEEEAK
ncbi:MAG: hypothetical protein U0930_05580 [Pirellulales bacterium]